MPRILLITALKAPALERIGQNLLFCKEDKYLTINYQEIILINNNYCHDSHVTIFDSVANRLKKGK